MNNPEEDFVKFLCSKNLWRYVNTKVKDTFAKLTKKAANQYINSQINERLKSAIGGGSLSVIDSNSHNEEVECINKEETDIATTMEELEGFHIVKAIVRVVLDAPRIVHRDTKAILVYL